MTDGFQLAAAEQTDALERVYRAAAHTNERSVFQWRATFPTCGHIIRDIAERDLFVLVRGSELAGSVAVNRSRERTPPTRSGKGRCLLGCCTAFA